jgi:hypothetical protein
MTCSEADILLFGSKSVRGLPGTGNGSQMIFNPLEAVSLYFQPFFVFKGEGRVPFCRA